MTDEKLTDVSITNAEEFEGVLAAAVEKAIKADVDVHGAWEFQTKGSTYEWEVQVIELDRDEEEEQS